MIYAELMGNYKKPGIKSLGDNKIGDSCLQEAEAVQPVQGGDEGIHKQADDWHFHGGRRPEQLPSAAGEILQAGAGR